MTKNSIEFGNFFISENMPCVEIKWYDKEYKKNRTSYLYCFRNYCFQVCGNKEGENDQGSTPVFGLDTFGSIQQRGKSNLLPKTTTLYIISCVARDALEQFARRRGLQMPKHAIGKYTFGSNSNYDLFLESTYAKYVDKVTDFKENDDWSIFIEDDRKEEVV